MTRNEENLKELCACAAADIRLCRVAYAVIDNAPAEEKPALFEAFINAFRTGCDEPTMDLPPFISEGRKNRLMMKYSGQVDRRMMALQKLNLSETAYYDRLWTYISTTPALPEPEARVVALYNCVIDRRLPYYAVDRGAALSIDKEDFDALTEDIGQRQMGRMAFLMNADFDRESQKASLLLSMLEALPTFELRTVFLAHILTHARRDLLRARLRHFADSRESMAELLEPFPFEDDGDTVAGLDIDRLFREAEDGGDGDDE